MFYDDTNVKVKQEFIGVGISGASKETNQVNDDVCLEEQSHTSNDKPKNKVICLDIESSSVDESPPDTSFCEVIGTTDKVFWIVCLRVSTNMAQDVIIGLSTISPLINI